MRFVFASSLAPRDYKCEVTAIFVGCWNWRSVLVRNSVDPSILRPTTHCRADISKLGYEQCVSNKTLLPKADVTPMTGVSINGCNQEQLPQMPYTQVRRPHAQMCFLALGAYGRSRYCKVWWLKPLQSIDYVAYGLRDRVALISSFIGDFLGKSFGGFADPRVCGPSAGLSPTG